MSYFPPFIHSKDKMEVELDLSNYATKPNLQNAKGGDTSLFARKDDLANLKSEVDQIGIDKLFESDANKFERVHADISNLSHVIKRMRLKRKIIMLTSKTLKLKYLVLLT